MTISLEGHSMVNTQGNLVVIGGQSGQDDYLSSLYQLSCYNGYCQWQEMKQTLKTARSQFVAMTVPENYVDCCDTSVDPNCNKICKEDEVKCKTTFRCIKKTSLCDGIKDCDDGSDEDKCGKGVFCQRTKQIRAKGFISKLEDVCIQLLYVDWKS